MSFSPDRTGALNMFQTAPNLEHEDYLSDTKVPFNNINIRKLSHSNKLNSSLNNPTITKALSNLSSEMLIHSKKQETLSQQIKSSKSLYIQQLKQYKALIQSIIQFENNLDNIHLKLTSIKTHQRLILESITDDNFQYLLGIIPRIKNEVYEGFLSFVNFDDYKKEQMQSIMNSKTNLINLLENGFDYLELMFSLSKNKYYSTRNKIAMIQSNNNIVYPFELIYDYFKYTFEFIDQNDEFNIMQNKLNDLNDEKNKRFLELKSLENEILKKYSTLQNIKKYVTNINTLLEKTKNTNNNEITNHKILNGSNEEKIEEEQLISHNESVPVISKTNTQNHRNPQKRNLIQRGHNKQSSLTHSSMFSHTNVNINNNVLSNTNPQLLSATVKIKPITSLCLHNNNLKKKKNIKPKPAVSKVKSISSNTVINIKTNILETMELIKITQNSCAMNTQLSNNKFKNKKNVNNKIKTKSNSPHKINNIKHGKTRNNSLFSQQFLTSKQQTNKVKQKILKSFKSKVINTSFNKSDNEQNKMTDNSENKHININKQENKNVTETNNLTDQSENYHIHTNSKDSFNISDINSVCDELTVSPLSLLPGTINNTTNNNSISSNITHSNYIHNHYDLMQRHRNYNSTNYSKKVCKNKVKNNFINFKIEKPIPSGGCCVSCT